MSRSIHLYTPYYLSEVFERQQELDRCLAANVAVERITKIFLLVDDGHRPDIQSDKIAIIDTTHRPTYADWIDLTARHSADAISVLANSDIYFDDTVGRLEEIFDATGRGFVAISRYEVQKDTATLHKTPRWSQDAWAIDGRKSVGATLRDNTIIPLGVPRCDNKIAYLFSVHGHDVFNPCNFVKTYHLHETNLRSYDNHVDKRILGGTAWVEPSTDIVTPARLVIDVWTLKPDPVERIKVNDTIIVKERNGLGSPKKRIPPAIVAYDMNWQFPAITEQHAFERLAADLDLRDDTGSVVYLAYPWATLIDNLLHNKKNPERAAFLNKKLLSLKPKLSRARTVITVCQHIHMLRFQQLFAEIGVTDIFWSHATIGQTALPDHPGVAIHPFPLYPVQAKDAWKEPRQKKKHLYSFIGARANQYYLTQSRNIILEDLAATNTGFVAGNDTWHYNKVVYDYQIRGTTDKSDALIDDSASERFRTILQQSVFSLCPSGTGPNSIRLWESIGLGAIPVILADTLALPGNRALWDEAAVFCKEDRASILGLPDQLKKIHADATLLDRKRRAMDQIWAMYGLENFVYDVVALFLRKTQEHRLSGCGPANAVQADARIASHLTLPGLVNEILLDPATATRRLNAERPLIAAIAEQASPPQKDRFIRALRFKGLDAEWTRG